MSRAAIPYIYPGSSAARAHRQPGVSSVSAHRRDFYHGRPAARPPADQAAGNGRRPAWAATNHVCNTALHKPIRSRIT